MLDIYGINVGKYTGRPMDGIGMGYKNPKEPGSLFSLLRPVTFGIRSSRRVMWPKGGENRFGQKNGSLGDASNPSEKY